MFRLFVIVALSASAVSYTEIPLPKCSGPHEVWTEAKPSCPPEVCFQISAFFNCDNTPPDAPGCACEPGYLRRNLTSPCIRICQCPEMVNAPECQKENASN